MMQFRLRSRSRFGLAVAIGAAASLGWGASARSDAPLVVGATGNAAVEINLDALDQLGTPDAPRPLGPVIIMPIPSAVVISGVEIPGRAEVAVPVLPVAQEPLNLAPPPLPAAPPPEPAAAPAEPVAAPEPAETQVAAVTPGPLPEPEPVPAQPIEPVVIAPEPDAGAPTAPEPLPEPEPVVASLEPAGPIDLTEPGQVLSVGFAADESELRPETVSALAGLVAAMRRDEGARIQLLAYAGASGGSASTARRLSLSRALAVRGYLIENGVRSTRIDVRALGDNVDEGSPERVDVVALPR
ncbi:MAG: OmpA family protein [Alphaproteobacteria bacterium]